MLTLSDSTVSTMTTRAKIDEMMVPTHGVFQLAWTWPKALGNTPSRAIEKLSRLDGSNVVCVVATVDESTASTIR